MENKFKKDFKKIASRFSQLGFQGEPPPFEEFYRIAEVHFEAYFYRRYFEANGPDEDGEKEDLIEEYVSKKLLEHKLAIQREAEARLHAFYCHLGILDKAPFVTREALIACGFKSVRKKEIKKVAKSQDVEKAVKGIIKSFGVDFYNEKTDQEIIELIRKRTKKSTTRATLSSILTHRRCRELIGRKKRK